MANVLLTKTPGVAAKEWGMDANQNTRKSTNMRRHRKFLMERHTKPMPRTVDTRALKREWQRCYFDKQRSRDKLYAVVWPFIRHWVEMLCDRDYPKDINYISMLSLLKVDYHDPIELVDKWLLRWDDPEDIEHLLWEIFLLRLKRFLFVPTYATKIMFEFVLARDFKLYLRHKIRMAANWPVFISLEEEIPIEDPEYEYPIYLTAYEQYIVDALQAGVELKDLPYRSIECQ